MTHSDFPDFLVERLWIDRKILEYLVPKPDVFLIVRVKVSRAKIRLLKKLAFEISQCANDCPASF